MFSCMQYVMYIGYAFWDDAYDADDARFLYEQQAKEIMSGFVFRVEWHRLYGLQVCACLYVCMCE